MTLNIDGLYSKPQKISLKELAHATKVILVVTALLKFALDHHLELRYLELLRWQTMVFAILGLNRAGTSLFLEMDL